MPGALIQTARMKLSQRPGKKRCLSRPTGFKLPAHLEKQSKKRNKEKKCGNQRVYTYDRDIICLPKSHGGRDGLVKIPRKKSMRDYLAMNHLIGKIRLNSEMSEGEIFQEIRSVFDGPMASADDFPFKILQTCGGGSKTLATPVLSSSFKWTANAVAGRNAKVPIYILAEDDLVMCGDLSSSDEETSWKGLDISDGSRSPSLPQIDLNQKDKDGSCQDKDRSGQRHFQKESSKGSQDVVIIKDEYSQPRYTCTQSSVPGPSKPSTAGASKNLSRAESLVTHKRKQWELSVYDDYVNLLSDDEEGKPSSPEYSPSPPTYSPLSQDNVIEDHVQSDTIYKIIKDNRVKHLPVDRDEYSRIVVRRRHLWGDAMNHMKNLNEKKYTRVTFVGEPAVDEGGPLREFFHLLTAEIAKKNMLFCGDEDKRIPRHCMMELENGTYYLVGKAIALSIMHGGPAPEFFARSVFEYIAYGSTQASPLDVPDKAIRESLIKLQDVTSVDEMRALLDSDEFDFRYDIGIAQPSKDLQLGDCARVIKLCAAHYTIHSVKAELDQLCDGLRCMDVLQLIQQHPVLMRTLFMPHTPKPLNADSMISMFATKFSPPGANSREGEEAAVMKWVQFLQAVEDNQGHITCRP